MTGAREGARDAVRRFRPYPNYRDSGVEWLGGIPAHWEVRPVRRLIRRIEQGWSPVADDRPAALDEWGVITLSAVNKGRFLGHEHKALPADVAPDRRLEIREGEFLLTRANTPQLVGDVCVARGVRRGLMLCDLVYRLQLESAQLDPSYFAYWFLSRPGRHQIEIDARGSSQSMVKVSQGHIRAWTVVLPPVDEQRDITAFLDWQTARIDALVAKKGRLIELLREERAAVITRATTKGLDPSAPTRASGVDWLGPIPAHWEVIPLGQALRLVMDYRGRTPLKLGMTWGGDIPAISAANVRDGHLDLSLGVNYGSPALHDRWMTEGPTRAGDIVFTTEAPLGNVATLTDDERYILSQRVVLLRPRPERMDPLYLFHFLRSSAFRQGVDSRATGSTAEGVKRRHLMSMPICVPPLAEQASISRSLFTRLLPLEQVLPLTEEAIRQLQKLREALISAAVTGKIDVRAEVA